ncbi:hypothetical protein RF11_08886 [Thelohanellus kitauei]|uniref:Uncharacterized protein n=1 Tax=Thelohanellus kitauei TaxID=669202 RepID=A0A0C2IUZ0_THEKT|nr:hypothetical protein RF11_08886 [Thelohanellus kitauei]
MEKFEELARHVVDDAINRQNCTRVEIFNGTEYAKTKYYLDKIFSDPKELSSKYVPTQCALNALRVEYKNFKKFNDNTTRVEIMKQEVFNISKGYQGSKRNLELGVRDAFNWTNGLRKKHALKKRTKVHVENKKGCEDHDEVSDEKIAIHRSKDVDQTTTVNQTNKVLPLKIQELTLPFVSTFPEDEPKYQELKNPTTMFIYKHLIEIIVLLLFIVVFAVTSWWAFTFGK